MRRTAKKIYSRRSRKMRGGTRRSRKMRGGVPPQTVAAGLLMYKNQQSHVNNARDQIISNIKGKLSGGSRRSRKMRGGRGLLYPDGTFKQQWDSSQGAYIHKLQQQLSNKHG
jgi:hypothetical protein